MFFSFDGIDGVGKSTQIALFCEWLAERGVQIVQCRDPGSTPLGEKIRNLLLTHDESTNIHRRAEMLLYMAARAQLVEQVIRPALDRGEVVVSDRYVLANRVYQGHAGGLPLKQVQSVADAAIAGIAPDIVFLLDMPVHLADERLGESRDRMESEGDAFRQRLRDGFLVEAERHPDTIRVIDATRKIDEIQQHIRDVAAEILQA